MDADSIVQTLGSFLMGSEGEQRQGRNQSLYAEPIDKVLNPYRKEWMRRHLAEYASKHKSGDAARFETCVKHLKAAQQSMEDIFVIMDEKQDSISADVYVIKHWEGPNRLGYKQWEPQISLSVSRQDDGKATVNLRFEEDCFSMVLSARGFRSLLARLSTLPVDCEKHIIRTHYREFLPEDLQDLYAKVAITEDMGNSSSGGGGYYYGHEVELKPHTHHRFQFAYISEYLWNPEQYNTLFGTIRTAYHDLERISSMLPGLAVVSDDADDCGTNLSRTLRSRRDMFMDKITSWSEGKRVTKKIVKEVMTYLNYDTERFSPEIVLKIYRKEKKCHDLKVAEVKSVLDPQNNGWVLESKWKEMRLYVSGERAWSREVYIAIPYDCPKETYMKILDAKTELSTFFSHIDKRDVITSVGIFPKK